MFTNNQEEYLIRAINRNDVLLFLGSGFPRLAKNAIGEKLPLAKELSKKLWDFLGYDGDYDDTPLGELFDAFVAKGISRDKKKIFLENNLLAKEVPDKYRIIKKCYWYKIYTTNIDNVLDEIYTPQETEKLVFPLNDFKERDQLLNTILKVYLHGKLPCNPEDLIFSKNQYVDEKLESNYLYIQFVLEYITKPVVFLGTSLNEPLLDYYLRARNKKSRFSENRPKSFLISPSASPVKIDNLSRYNIDYIKGDTNDFLEWLETNNDRFFSREEILQMFYPSVLFEAKHDLKDISNKYLTEFFKCFKAIKLPIKVDKNYRSGFLMGSTPSWSDVAKELDIKRNIQDEILDAVHDHDSSKKIKFILITGSAGTGKSTVLKRLAYLLTQGGVKSYFSYSEYLPSSDVIFNVLSGTKKQSALFFDNAENILKYLDNYIESFVQLDNPPILFLGIRSYYLHYLSSEIKENCDIDKFDLDELTISEIRQIIEKLDNYGLLGALKGLTDHVRERIFERKAKKQLLVAMKEATSGKNFDEIIKDEYQSLKDADSKLVYICIALNTELGYSVSLRDVVSFSGVIPNEALDIIQNRLKGIVKKGGTKKDKYIIRHRVIAEYVLNHCADKRLLCKAYKSVLTTLAPEIKYNRSSKRKFTLYTRLISHNRLYRRFKNNIDTAREVYDSIQSHFNDDYHYWLQYGSLETEGYGGDFSLAENYLNQADSIMPNNPFVLTSKANLFYKIANGEQEKSRALDYKTEADEIITNIIENRAESDPYSVHIYCRGNLNWVLNKVDDTGEQLEKLKELEAIANKYSKKHSLDKRLQDLADKITKAKLDIASLRMPSVSEDDDIDYEVGLLDNSED